MNQKFETCLDWVLSMGGGGGGSEAVEGNLFSLDAEEVDFPICW